MKTISTGSAGRLGRAAAVAMLLALGGCSTELYSNLSEREANQMVEVLAQQGIEATRETAAEGKYTISVPSGDFSTALSTLTARGLPRKNFGSLGEVFNSDKLVSTPFEERARFMHAMNEELAASLTEIDGVVSARVHINLPEEDALGTATAIPRASVFIYQAGNTDLSAEIPTIKNLIVNSVPNLRYDAVTVALFTANATSPNPSGGTLFSASNANWLGILPMAVLLVLGLFGLKYSLSRPTKALPQPVAARRRQG